jgi:hypothetical protein
MRNSRSREKVWLTVALLLSLTPVDTSAQSVGGVQLAADFTGESQNAFAAELTFGWSFSVDSTTTLFGLGFFDDFLDGGPGLRQDHLVRLWTDQPENPQLIASSTITNDSLAVASTASDGRWLVNMVDPIELLPGQYVIGADDPACIFDCDRIRFLNSVTTIPGITFIEARGTSNSPAGFPANSSASRNDGYFGPTLLVATVPEPASCWLLGCCLTACGLARRRRLTN